MIYTYISIYKYISIYIYIYKYIYTGSIRDVETGRQKLQPGFGPVSSTVLQKHAGWVCGKPAEQVSFIETTGLFCKKLAGWVLTSSVCAQKHAGWVKNRGFYVPECYCTRRRTRCCARLSVRVPFLRCVCLSLRVVHLGRRERARTHTQTHRHTHHTHKQHLSETRP